MPVAPTDDTALGPLSALAQSTAKAAHWTPIELGKVAATPGTAPDHVVGPRKTDRQ
ncbi:hypothetical protein OTB20_41725 [Streptomyces sp. H27-H1]|uniref:hypothetical protein n=1 Tax=Streptomyces sp. H27-H1 TaxID=2996461 RepID=UPI00227055C9|nr:hypothetical protein [Streptomyces sp. H27-H1]MCY0932534.1 hypothetical protein [Streptomyces sp. H27-H1]